MNKFDLPDNFVDNLETFFLTQKTVGKFPTVQQKIFIKREQGYRGYLQREKEDGRRSRKDGRGR
jgi:hypothetical protein